MREWLRRVVSGWRRVVSGWRVVNGCRRVVRGCRRVVRGWKRVVRRCRRVVRRWRRVVSRWRVVVRGVFGLSPWHRLIGTSHGSWSGLQGQVSISWVPHTCSKSMLN